MVPEDLALVYSERKHLETFGSLSDLTCVGSGDFNRRKLLADNEDVGYVLHVTSGAMSTSFTNVIRLVLYRPPA